MRNLTIDLKDVDLNIVGCYELSKALKENLMTIQPSFKEYAYLDESKYCHSELALKRNKRLMIIEKLLTRIMFIKTSKFIELYADASDEMYNPEIMKRGLLKINQDVLDLYPKRLVESVKRMIVHNLIDTGGCPFKLDVI